MLCFLTYLLRKIKKNEFISILLFSSKQDIGGKNNNVSFFFLTTLTGESMHVDSFVDNKIRCRMQDVFCYHYNSVRKC